MHRHSSLLHAHLLKDNSFLFKYHFLHARLPLAITMELASMALRILTSALMKLATIVSVHQGLKGKIVKVCSVKQYCSMFRITINEKICLNTLFSDNQFCSLSAERRCLQILLKNLVSQQFLWLRGFQLLKFGTQIEGFITPIWKALSCRKLT